MVVFYRFPPQGEKNQNAGTKISDINEVCNDPWIKERESQRGRDTYEEDRETMGATAIVVKIHDR